MWEKQSDLLVYANYRRILSRMFKTPDGLQDFEIKLEEDAAAIVTLTQGDKVVLVREFRPGTEEWLLELPGGNVEPGESAVVSATRELLEETGYAATPRYVGSMVDCAYSTRRRHVFVADDATKVQESPEGLEVVLMTAAGFREHLRAGNMTDVGAGYRGLDALGLL